jgi:hypothetical protein
MHDDTIDETVGRFAPTAASAAAQWTPARQESVLTSIVGGHAASGRDLDVVHELLVDAPTTRARRRRALLPLAASVAVFAAAAGTVVALLPGSSGSNDAGSAAVLPTGSPFDPPAGLSTKALPAGTWSYDVTQQNDIDAQGRVVANGTDSMTIRTWTNARGDVYDERSGQQNGCTFRPLRHAAGLEFPTVAFFRSLPTDVTKLRAYLRSQAQGSSSSRDEAVFVAVADTLRTAGALASPRLRAAFVAVLSRTPGVILHRNALDQLGRPALRLDFVDQQIRPGEVHSLFFSPTDFRLVEERFGSNGAPKRYTGPSPAYTHSASTGVDPQALTGKAYVETHTGDRLVHKLPSSLHTCTTSTGDGG